MDRFTQLEAFVAVAEEGGFNAAARRLKRSPPTVTRLVAALEARIGARLFTRSTRRIALTEAGARLFQDAIPVLQALAGAEAAAAGAHVAPQGVLAVTAPVLFGQRYVAPLVRSFIDAHPRVTARVLFVDRVVNLIEEGLDVAVRIGSLPASRLTAVRVGDLRRVVVASPAYLEAHGAPKTPGDLARHRVATARGTAPDGAWEFVAEGRRRVAALEPVLESNAVGVAIDAAEAGWALTRTLSYQVAPALADGRLVEVLAAFEDRRTPVHLVHAEGPLRAAKIRAFVEHARAALRREPALRGR